MDEETDSQESQSILKRRRVHCNFCSIFLVNKPGLVSESRLRELSLISQLQRTNAKYMYEETFTQPSDLHQDLQKCCRPDSLEGYSQG